MGAYVFPVDAVTGAPSYTGRVLRQALSVLVGGGVSGRLAGSSGVPQRYASASTVTASSSTWTVLPHGGYIDGETSALAGGYLYSFDTNQTGSMTAANATNPRIDLISAQISDPAEGDGSSVPSVAIVYTTGTAAATPSAPATPVRSLALAQISVPASGGGSPTVAWVAPVLMGNTAGPRVQAVQAASSSIPSGSGSFTVLTGLSTTSANGGVNMIAGLTNSGGVLTMPTGSAGQWEVDGQVSLNTPSGVTGVGAAIQQNGANILSGELPAFTGQLVTVAFPAREITVADGDTFSLAGYSFSAATTSFTSTASYRSFIRLKRIS